MNEPLKSKIQNNETPQSDLQRLSDWLNGEVTVSRKVLAAGAVILMLLFGVALD